MARLIIDLTRDETLFDVTINSAVHEQVPIDRLYELAEQAITEAVEGLE